MSDSQKNFTLTDSFSQYGQDYDCLQFFNYKRNGFFVDIGAYDGKTFSNSYLLEKKYDWKGICCEPAKETFKLLQKCRTCSLCNKGISDKIGEQKFYIPKGWLIVGTFEGGEDAVIRTYPTTTLFQLLEDYKAPPVIDFISLDTERHELKILKKFFEDNEANKNKYKLVFIDVETNGYLDGEEYRNEVFKFLSEKNYVFLAKTPNDDYYCHKKNLPKIFK